MLPPCTPLLAQSFSSLTLSPAPMPCLFPPTDKAGPTMQKRLFRQVVKRVTRVVQLPGSGKKVLELKEQYKA